MKTVEQLNGAELLNLLNEYNIYIMDFYDTHSSGEYPVSVYEFYHNEYQDILKGTE